MYLRTTQRRNKDGGLVRYVQLAHNRRVDGVTQAEVLVSLGREDALDRDGLVRLVASINRYLGLPDSNAPGEVAELVGEGLTVAGSRPMGTAHLLDGLWRQLGVGSALRKVLGARRFTTDVERVLFALVANLAIDPASKLAAAEWASFDVAIPGMASMGEDQAYRAMDLLVEADAQAKVQEAVFFAVADLLNLEVDLLLFDTSSASRTRHRRHRGRGVPPVRALQGPPARPAADRHRPGRHQGRDPGALLVLAGQHQRPGRPPRSAGWDAGLAPGPGRHHRRPRHVLGGEPGLPDPRRRALHRRRTHALRRTLGGAGGVEAGPLLQRAGQPAREGSPPRRRPRSTVDHLPQPRRSRTREGHPRRRPAAAGHRARPDQDDAGTIGPQPYDQQDQWGRC